MDALVWDCHRHLGGIPLYWAAIFLLGFDSARHGDDDGFSNSSDERFMLHPFLGTVGNSSVKLLVSRLEALQPFENCDISTS